MCGGGIPSANCMPTILLSISCKIGGVAPIPAAAAAAPPADLTGCLIWLAAAAASTPNPPPPSPKVAAAPAPISIGPNIWKSGLYAAALTPPPPPPPPNN